MTRPTQRRENLLPLRSGVDYRSRADADAFEEAVKAARSRRWRQEQEKARQAVPRNVVPIGK